MSRRRPDHSGEMESRDLRRTGRARRRRRRLGVALIKGVFWTLVLAGVFVLGLGYGRTISSDDSSASTKVTITQPRGTVQATLPTKTVTVTKTVTTKAKPATRRSATATRRD